MNAGLFFQRSCVCQDPVTHSPGAPCHQWPTMVSTLTLLIDGGLT